MRRGEARLKVRLQAVQTVVCFGGMDEVRMDSLWD